MTAGPPWRVAEVTSSILALTGESDPTVGRLLAFGDRGRRLEQLRCDIERAGDRLPPTLEGVRRTRLVGWDSSTTLWEGWHGESGARTMVRALRPGVQERAFERLRVTMDVPQIAPPGSIRLVGGARFGGGIVEGARAPSGAPPGQPHPAALFLGPILGTLADVLPLEEPEEDAVWRSRVLGGALRTLVALHAAGRVHGMVCPELLVLGEHLVPGRPAPRQEWRLLWPGPPDVPRPLDPRDDLRALGLIGELLGDPLVAGFAEHPPPSAADAARLYAAALSAELVAACRRVWFRARFYAPHDRAERLHASLVRLEAAAPPPVGEGCVRAGRDGVLVMVRSDGRRVWGGPSTAVGLRQLPTLVEDGRLDVAGVRAILRAGATRPSGDEARRALVMADLGASEASLDGLVRWLAARMWLRTDRMLLEARASAIVSANRPTR